MSSPGRDEEKGRREQQRQPWNTRRAIRRWQRDKGVVGGELKSSPGSSCGLAVVAVTSRAAPPSFAGALVHVQFSRWPTVQLHRPRPRETQGRALQHNTTINEHTRNTHTEAHRKSVLTTTTSSKNISSFLCASFFGGGDTRKTRTTSQPAIK